MGAGLTLYADNNSKLHTWDGVSDKIVGEDVPTPKGLISAFGMAQITATVGSSSTTFADVAGSTVTLNLPCQCTVLMFSTGTFKVNGQKYEAHLRGVIDGAADPVDVYTINDDSSSNGNWPPHPFSIVYAQTGLAAGGHTVKLQAKVAPNNNYSMYVYYATVIGLAFSE